MPLCSINHCHLQPLRYRDAVIPQAQKERFQQLDLEVLLSEFKAIAALKEVSKHFMTCIE
jgi:hypothetical protein